MHCSKLPVLILSGGKGTRLRSVVNDRPKPLATVDGKPFLYWLIQRVLRFKNISGIFILSGYLSNQIDKFLLDYLPDSNIKNLAEDQPLGTGGAIKSFFKQHPQFGQAIVMNGDTFSDINLDKFIENSQTLDNVIALTKITKNTRYGSVDLDPKTNLIRGFFEKKEAELNALINLGIYKIQKNSLDLVDQNIFSLEGELLPIMARNRKLFGDLAPREFIDIGVPSDFNLSQEIVPNMRLNI